MLCLLCTDNKCICNVKSGYALTAAGLWTVNVFSLLKYYELFCRSYIYDPVNTPYIILTHNSWVNVSVPTRLSHGRLRDDKKRCMKANLAVPCLLTRRALPAAGAAALPGGGSQRHWEASAPWCSRA